MDLAELVLAVLAGAMLGDLLFLGFVAALIVAALFWMRRGTAR